MADIKLIAFDLDGTLLNDKKELTEENRRALLEAAEKGIYLVPTTGRFSGAMPEFFRELPIRYAIFMNGAQIYDLQENRVLDEVLVPWEQGIEIFEYFEWLPVIYDCYMDNKAYMSAAYRPQIEEYALNEHFLWMMRDLRTTVPELKAFMAEKKMGIQKLQAYFRPQHYPLRAQLLENLNIPGIAISSSIPNNLELNHADATKGHALRKLAKMLNIPMEATMSFGDGSNDLTMIRMAGIGVAMENGIESVRRAADYVTCDCNNSGVGAAIRKFCL
mgnify:CR=1 FL=1